MRFRDRRLLSLLLVALASVAALALSACGGGDDGDSGDATALLKEAFSKPIKAANVSLDLSAKIDGVPQLSQPITFKMTGPYESRGDEEGPEARLGRQRLRRRPDLQRRPDLDGRQRVRRRSRARTTRSAASWSQQYEQQLGAADSRTRRRSSSTASTRPTGSSDAKEEGDEDVAGAETTKVTGTLDIEKMLNDFNTLIEKAGPAMGQSSTPEAHARADRAGQAGRQGSEVRGVRRQGRQDPAPPVGHDRLHDPRGAAPAGQGATGGNSSSRSSSRTSASRRR